MQVRNKNSVSRAPMAGMRVASTLSAAVALALALAASGGLSFAAPAIPAVAKPPSAARHPVEDRYFDKSVVDDYRWLEDWSDPAVKLWSEGENAYAREILDDLPARAEILEQVTALTRTIAPAYSRLRYCRGAWFALKEEPPKQQPLLVRMKSVEAPVGETVILDPNQLDPAGGTSIDFFVPALDGSKVAVSLSRGGSESGTVYVYDGATGAKLPDEVPGVNGGTAGGSVAWTPDAGGFFHTRYPQKGERPDADLDFYQQVYFHKLGMPAAADTYVIGKDFPKIAEILLSTSEDGRFILLDLLNGDGGEHAFYLRGPSAGFVQVTRFEDEVVEGAIGDDGLYLLSHHDGALNGKILRLALDNPNLSQAQVVVPPSDAAIAGFEPARSRLYVLDMVGGPSRVRIVTLAGAPDGEMPLPPTSSVNALVRAAGDSVLVARQSYTEPRGWYRFDPASRKLKPTALLEKSPASFADIEVQRVFATSKDGTRVPVNVLLRQGTPLDGTAPLLLSGYGGYGSSQIPAFGARRRVWFDQGGILAIANLRGGGEYGEAWHRAGKLTHKHNVFDDFIAAAEYLVEHRYTSRARLAIEGGSNGGLLVGAALVQHPDLFGAVVAHVGIYDMLRFELSPNGLFNTTEFGTVKDPEQFAAMYAYSPYHHVVDGVKYPPVLFMTGANDPRVDPMNSRKMTARLRAAVGSAGNLILLRTSSTTGHGIGSPLSERNEQAADVFAFLFHELGVAFKPPPAGTR